MARKKDSEKVSRKALPARLFVVPGQHVRLLDRNAGRTYGWDEDEADRALKENRERLEDLQYEMYADGRFALLVVLQAIDAGGKDGTIRKVGTAFNPQGCTVTSFKAPSSEELKHDYLWRIHQHVPRRGEIGIFNRSHYEDVIIARVDNLVPRAVWVKRYAQINDFERMLTENHVRVVKLFLHISKDEQKRRFEARLREPHKRWKWDPQDLEKRKQWDEYLRAFEAALTHCSSAHAPWYVVPADRKWFRNFVVSQILVQELEKMHLRFPAATVDPSAIHFR
jgi:PPK2 family polyphosphate:nucleotide phosphotransferase